MTCLLTSQVYKEFYAQKVVTSIVASDKDNGEDESIYTVAGVCEMKNNKRGVTQLVANMTHFGTQLTVGALREGVVVDKCVIYGLSINYKDHNARHMKMTMEFDNVKTTIQDYGVFPLIKVFNQVVDKLITKM